MHTHVFRRLLALFAVTASLAFSSAAQAQFSRTYLSVSGSDANSCTRQQPCRNVPRALQQTNAGGEIWLLDSAQFNVGPIIINKAVTILAVPGVLGTIEGNGGDAIAVAAGVDVTLRNLNIVFVSGTGSGLAVTSAGARVVVQNCDIHGFRTDNANGIFVSAASALTVLDSSVRDSFNGINLQAGASAVIARTHVLDNLEEGIVADSEFSALPVNAFISDTVSSGNSWGFSANGFSASAPARVFTFRTVAVNNFAAGYDVWGGFGEVYMDKAIAAGNERGADDFVGVTTDFVDGGVLFTATNNLVTGNSTDVRGTLTSFATK